MEYKYLIAAAIALVGENVVKRSGGVPENIRPQAELLAKQLQELTEDILVNPAPVAPAADDSTAADNSAPAANQAPATADDAAPATTENPPTEQTPAADSSTTADDAAPAAEQTPAASEGQTTANDAAPATTETTPADESPASTDNSTAEPTPAASDDSADERRGISDSDLLNILADKESKNRSLDVSIAAYLYGEDSVKDGLSDDVNRNRIGYVKGLITRYFKTLQS